MTLKIVLNFVLVIFDSNMKNAGHTVEFDDDLIQAIIDLQLYF